MGRGEFRKGAIGIGELLVGWSYLYVRIRVPSLDTITVLGKGSSAAQPGRCSRLLLWLL